MNEETLEALLGSINKWQKIVDGTETEKGPYNCALCQLFQTPVDDANDFDCVGCPVYSCTGHKYCENTPYIQWLRFRGSAIDLSKGYRATTKRQRELAQAELDFLKSLLPNGEEIE